MKRKVALHNLGCKVNAYETEAMQQLLELAGYEIVPFESFADIYIVNTCTVTNIADRKSRQMLHRAKKQNPDAVVVAAGCYVQTDEEKLEKDSSIDILIGNNRKAELIPMLDAWYAEKEKQKNLSDINREKEYEELHIDRTEEHTRAYIKVQDGCNQFCSYCMIPYARGRIRSRKIEDVKAEVERLAASGCQEVVLTGIHLSSYGKEREQDGETLLMLIQEISKVDKIARIRLGSLEPGIITEDFAMILSKNEKFCPHFHLSLQSGCSATLQRMNRKYTAEEYRQKCELLRKYFENPSLTTDVIVGFPGETEEEYQESKQFVESIGFFETHIFPYSKRKGTRAASMPDQVLEEIKKVRSKEMIALGERKRTEYLQYYLGQEKEVLFEEQQSFDGVQYWVGHTKEYLKVAAASEENLENKRSRVSLKKVGAEGVVFSRILY